MPNPHADARRVASATRRSVRTIRVGGSTSRRQLDLVSIVHEGDADGPTVALVANVHGDEVTGTGVVLAVDRWVSEHGLRGRLVLYPSANPEGLAARQRAVPEDGQDLNRLFPGSARGSWAPRLAHALWNDLVAHTPDSVVDLHADAPHAIPYVICDRPARLPSVRRTRLSAQILAMAEATGFTILREYQDDIYLQYGLDRSLAGAVVNLLGKPAVTIESGPRRRLDPQAVACALHGTLGALGSLGLVDVDPVIHATRRVGAWRRSGAPRAKFGGLVETFVQPGELVKAGQRLASLTSLTGRHLGTIAAHSDGVLVALNESGWLASGASVATLGVPDGGPL